MKRIEQLMQSLIPATLAVTVANAPAQAKELDANFAERFGALACQRGYLEHLTLPGQRLDDGRHPFVTLLVCQQIDLVKHQPARPGGKLGAETLQLVHDTSRRLTHVDRRIRRRQIDDVQQQSRSLQMLEETDPESGTLRRSLEIVKRELPADDPMRAATQQSYDRIRRAIP